jgi:hypothetical protein
MRAMKAFGINLSTLEKTSLSWATQMESLTIPSNQFGSEQPLHLILIAVGTASPNFSSTVRHVRGCLGRQ